MWRQGLGQWWWENRKALACGLAAGLLWAFLTGGGATLRHPFVYDAAQGVVLQLREGAEPLAIPAEQFFAQFNVARIELAALLLAVSAPAGWATWQLTRLRPRGDEQLPLRPGVDAYLLALAAGGLACLGLFHKLGLAGWFDGPGLTPAAFLSAVVQVLLPLYMGAALFLVWLLRLKSARAPDWETHFPKPVKKAGGASWLPWRRRQGGDHRTEQ